jgi:predicted Fe-Mo cluster-binding NifX family protein
MKVCVTSQGNDLDSLVDPRFGRCQYFLIVETDTMEWTVIENPNLATGGGAGIQSAQLMSRSGVKVVLTGNCGPNAFRVFEGAGIQIITGVSEVVRDVIDKYKRGEYSETNSPTVDSHFGLGGIRAKSSDAGNKETQN